MNNHEQWLAANNVRATLYRWFADIFAHELNQENLTQLQSHYGNMHLAFTRLGLEQESLRLLEALNDFKEVPEKYRALELAADFAQLFLLSGRDSAPPYASYYLDEKQMLYGKPAQQMSRFLADNALSLHPNFREPKDHISVYLQVMSMWIQSELKHASTKQGTAPAQIDFLGDGLLTWLPKFVERCQHIAVKSDIYPATLMLLRSFVEKDLQGLLEL